MSPAGASFPSRCSSRPTPAGVVLATGGSRRWIAHSWKEWTMRNQEPIRNQILRFSAVQCVSVPRKRRYQRFRAADYISGLMFRNGRYPDKSTIMITLRRHTTVSRLHASFPRGLRQGWVTAKPHSATIVLWNLELPPPHDSRRDAVTRTTHLASGSGTPWHWATGPVRCCPPPRASRSGRLEGPRKR